jgi:predicted component of type VI protein secretion system
VIVADKRCENGHFIDESWDLCPYCPADQSDPEIPIVRPTRLSDPQQAQQGPRAVATPPPPERARTAPSAPPATADRRDSGVVVPPPMERTAAVQVPKLDAAAAQKRYTVAWLVGLNGSLRGESFAVRIGRNVLGRDRRSDIVINDDQASSHHADLVFRAEERRFILMDHNSTNGTYVNDQEIEPRRDLALNDVVRIGSHRLLFVPLCHEGMFWDDEGALK